jgi:hypothetical protein
MTLSPSAGRSPFHVDPDFHIWVPALGPIELEGLDLTLQEWAAKVAGSSWAEGVEPDPDGCERTTSCSCLWAPQDYPSSVPWEDKWTTFPIATTCRCR